MTISTSEGSELEGTSARVSTDWRLMGQQKTDNSGPIGYSPYTYAVQASSTRTAGALPASAVLFFLFQSLFSNGAAISASSRIVLVSILIAHLTARLSSPKPMMSMVSGQRRTADLPVLSAFLEARIEISPYDPLIELGPANVFHAVQSILVCIVLHEAKTAGRFIESVKAHYQSLDLSTSAD